jgi:hypothetical protein
VTLFEKTSPDQATNKPVCFDCHGVHNIQGVDDPQYGLAMNGWAQAMIKVFVGMFL